MTSIISSISGYFSKSLILGTFLPVVVFIVLSALFLVPFLPLEFSALVRFQSLDKEWKAVAISFAAIVLSGLIYNLNIPILRLYEGYPWKNSWIGTFLTRQHQSRFDDALNRIRAMRACRSMMQATSKDFATRIPWVQEFFENWNALGSPLRGPGMADYAWLKKIWAAQKTLESHPSSPSFSASQVESGLTSSDTAKKDPKSDLQLQWEDITSNLTSQYGEYMRAVQRSYPDKRSLILPTRLGNAIRSFEYYPGREYRIDSIVMWPRLVAIIPKEYAVAVDDAKTTFDFMLNCSLLSLILAASILLVGLVYPTPLNSLPLTFYWFGHVALFSLLSYFFYRLSINRVSAWGSMVKSSFDLYRSDLLKKLGYKHEPASRKKERELWGEISRQMIYGDLDKTPQDYVEEAGPSYPSLSSTPAKAKLEITKGVKATSASDVLIFCLRIKNTDPTLEEANVVLTDKLSEGFDYEWDSAKVDSQAVSVSGTNPYHFNLGNIASTREIVLTYNGIRQRMHYAPPSFVAANFLNYPGTQKRSSHEPKR